MSYMKRWRVAGGSFTVIAYDGRVLTDQENVQAIVEAPFKEAAKNKTLASLKRVLRRKYGKNINIIRTKSITVDFLGNVKKHKQLNFF